MLDTFTQAVPAGEDPRAVLLAQLHDVVTPDSPGWWPPAPGWWILAATLMLAALLGVFSIVRHYRRQQYRRQALAHLYRIKSRQSNKDPSAIAHDIVYLLKRAFFSAYPESRADVAGVYGREWLKILCSGVKQLSARDVPETIESLLYEASVESPKTTEDLNTLFDFAEIWIRKHRKLSSAQWQQIVTPPDDNVERRITGGSYARV